MTDTRRAGARRDGEPGPATTSRRLPSTWLRRWRAGVTAGARSTGQRPRLAGSGSSWFVEGRPRGLGIAGRDFLVVEDERARRLVAVRTVRAAAGP